MFYYLSFTAALFAIGIFGVLARRSAMGIIISITIMLSAIIINLITFDRFLVHSEPLGHVWALFILIICSFELLIAVSAAYLWRSETKANSNENLNLLN